MTLVSRRDVLAGMALGSAALACGGTPLAVGPTQPSQPPPDGESTMTTPLALSANHQVVPLPFAAGSLTGLSERLITSHHENNYGGAVKNLNRVEQELAQITVDTPALIVAALRERELAFRNSKTLHEGYFANLGGDGRRSGSIDVALTQAYGTSTRWEEHMRATALGLGGGSGWAILGYELDTGALRTHWSGHHTQVLAMSIPLLVMDLYEHSYQMDFGAGVARYVDAFFANVNWDEVNRRFERAQRASGALRGATT